MDACDKAWCRASTWQPGLWFMGSRAEAQGGGVLSRLLGVPDTATPGLKDLIAGSFFVDEETDFQRE